MSTYTHRTISVYQYHESTRKQAEVKKKQAESREGKNVQGNLKEDVEHRPRLDESKDNSKKAGAKVDKSIYGPPPTRYRERREPIPPGTGIKRQDSLQVPTTPREGFTFALIPVDTGSTTDERAGSGTAQAALLDSFRQREEEREQAAKVIGEQLKLLYLRTQRPDRVSHCLQVQDELGMFQYSMLRVSRHASHALLSQGALVRLRTAQEAREGRFPEAFWPPSV